LHSTFHWSQASYPSRHRNAFHTFRAAIQSQVRPPSQLLTGMSPSLSLHITVGAGDVVGEVEGASEVVCDWVGVFDGWALDDCVGAFEGWTLVDGAAVGGLVSGVSARARSED
jgi:hypothetical protein